MKENKNSEILNTNTIYFTIQNGYTIQNSKPSCGCK